MDFMKPKPAAVPTVYDRLRQLKVSCGANKHHQATILICACIVEDINTKSSIIGTLSKVGLNPRHVAIILEKETGNDPQRHRWLRDA